MLYCIVFHPLVTSMFPTDLSHCPPETDAKRGRLSQNYSKVTLKSLLGHLNATVDFPLSEGNSPPRNKSRLGLNPIFSDSSFVYWAQAAVGPNIIWDFTMISPTKTSDKP